MTITLEEEIIEKFNRLKKMNRLRQQKYRELHKNDKKKDDDITPSFKKRETPLELSSIKTYIDKVNIVNKLINDKPLTDNIKEELFNLINNKSFNKKLILNEMNYLNYDKIDYVINILRNKYINDNTYKSYIQSLVIITSHINSLQNIYQKLTKINIFVNNQVENERKKNILKKKDIGKLINLNDENEILNNLNKLNNIEKKLYYAIYTLIPPRRLENRLLILTDENDIDKLNDNNNYLVLSSTPKKLVYNNYKTKKNYGKQIIEIPDILDNIIIDFIKYNKLNNGDFLFHLLKNNKQPLNQSNFSKKISNVFKEVYEKKITLQMIRNLKTSNINNYSYEEREKLATDMGHSINQQLKYSKHKSF